MVLNEGKPSINSIMPLLERLEDLKIRTALQDEWTDYHNDHAFVAGLWNEVCDMTEKLANDDADAIPDTSLDYKIIKKGCLVADSDKFVCEEAVKIKEWYSE